MSDKSDTPYYKMKYYLNKGDVILAGVNIYIGGSRYGHYIWIRDIQGPVNDPRVISDDSFYGNKPNYIQPPLKQYRGFYALKYIK